MWPTALLNLGAGEVKCFKSGANKLQVGRCGNSLAIRLSAAIVEAPILKERGDISVNLFNEFANIPGRKVLLPRDLAPTRIGALRRSLTVQPLTIST